MSKAPKLQKIDRPEKELVFEDFQNLVKNKENLIIALEESGYYLPPKSVITFQFLKNVISGKKKLLLRKDLKDISRIPHFPELHMPSLWIDLKKDLNIQKYFPETFILNNRTPPRSFILKVF